jgi:hypothetical protein
MKLSCRKLLSLATLIGLGGILLMSIGVLPEAQILPPDVGIITQLSGDVTYRNEIFQKTPENAQAFMKILQRDHFKVAADAMVQLVYFQSGRKETWKGPTAFVAGDAQSRPEGDSGSRAQPEVTILPTGVSQGTRRIPALLRRAGLSRSGIIQVRGPGQDAQKSSVLTREEQGEIATAKENYRNLKNQTKSDDITPELYLLGILADYEQFEEMEKVIRDARTVQPDNDILKKLQEWVETPNTQPAKK